MSTASHDEGSYIVDAESPAELARLLSQDRFFTKLLGLFPEGLHLDPLRNVLDLACGPGGWALEMANTFPAAQIIGVDISAGMVGYAQQLAEVQQLPNTRFRVMDIHQPLDFPDNFFDFVNARLLSGSMTKGTWPLLIQECRRILRPGGIICLTEDEWGITNSSAFQQLGTLLTQAMYLDGRTFSADGHQFAITPMLRPLLRKAGFIDIQSKANYMDHSVGTELWEPFYRDLLVVYKLVQPFIIAKGIATQEKLNLLYEQLPVEMQSENFCALWFVLSAWGKKHY